MKLLESFRAIAADGSRSPEERRDGGEHRAGEQLYECRDCGAKFAEPPAECDTCASTEIAHYLF